MKLNRMAIAIVGAALLGLAPLAAMASVDLTEQCGLTGSVGGATFSNPCNSQVVGTGVINPFLTIQNNGTEAGLNTDFTPLTSVTGAPDAKRTGGGYTSSITLGEIGVVTVGDVEYRQFFLDINESNGGNPYLDKYLSLDQFQLTVGGDGNLSSLAALQALPLVYNMDDGGDTAILMNYDLFAGSGKGTDLSILVESSLFGSDPNAFVNMFAEFGTTGQVAPDKDFGSSDGFEEFYALNATPVICPPGSTDPSCQPPVSSTGTIPEPSSSALAFLGLGLIGFSFWRRQRARGV